MHRHPLSKPPMRLSLPRLGPFLLIGTKVEPFCGSTVLSRRRSKGAADGASHLAKANKYRFLRDGSAIGTRSDAYSQPVETCCSRQVRNRAHLMAVVWATKRSGRSSSP